MLIQEGYTEKHTRCSLEGTEFALLRYGTIWFLVIEPDFKEGVAKKVTRITEQTARKYVSFRKI